MTAEYVLTVHDELSGLADDDHVQYALANKTRPSPWVAAGDLSGRSLADLGTRSHADLQNLIAPADDHTQYLLIDGTRAMAGTLDMAGNPIKDVNFVYNTLGSYFWGGSVLAPYLENVDVYSSNYWPSARNLAANQLPVINWQGVDQMTYTPGNIPIFIQMNRVITNTLPYNPLAMHFTVNNAMEYQNANGVAANLGLNIAYSNSPLQRADGAAIVTTGHVGWYDVPRLNAINAGSLAATYLINLYLTANLGASTAATFYPHIWIVNPGGTGAIVNEYGIWIQNLTKSLNSYGIYSQLQAGATKWFLFQTAGGAKIQLTGDLGFFGTAPVGQQTVTGSRGGNAALASLLTALANYGLIIDSTTV